MTIVYTINILSYLNLRRKKKSGINVLNKNLFIIQPIKIQYKANESITSLRLI